MSKNFLGKKVDEFVLLEQLGQGAFGSVYCAQNLNTKETVAIKSVQKSKLKEHNGMVGQLLKTEVQVLMQCNNQNVVKMMKYLESENNCYLVMEFCNERDLEQLWRKKNRKFSEQEAIQYLKQILNGMRGLHEMNVIHRDLKLANIMISSNVLKIGDLGFAKTLRTQEELAKDALGTLGTMAPEVIQFRPYGMLADMFSLGAMYYQMLFQQLPFSCRSQEDFLNEIKTQAPNLNRNNITVSKESQDLIIRMLQLEPNNRIKWSELYEHPLFNEVKDPRCGNLKQNLTVQQVVANQVDLRLNKQVYEIKKVQFDELNNENMYNKMNKAPIIEQKKVSDNAPTDEGQLKRAQEERLQGEKKENELQRTFQNYINERNTLVFLMTVLHEIQKLDHHNTTNVFFPAFMLAKKLLLEIDAFLDKINRQINIFDCQYFVDLNLRSWFKEFIKNLKADHDAVNANYNFIQHQMRQIFNRMPNPNNEYVEELQQRPSLNFAKHYKDVLVEYYFQIQTEREHTRNDQKINEITNLMIYILDAILYDFETKKMLQNTSTQEYFDLMNFKTDQEKDQLIEAKFNYLMTLM